MVILPYQAVNGSAVHQGFGHGQNRVIVAISIDGFAEKIPGPLTHLAEPVGGYQFTGVGIGIGERKKPVP